MVMAAEDRQHGIPLVEDDSLQQANGVLHVKQCLSRKAANWRRSHSLSGKTVYHHLKAYRQTLTTHPYSKQHATSATDMGASALGSMTRPVQAPAHACSRHIMIVIITMTHHSTWHHQGPKQPPWTVLAPVEGKMTLQIVEKLHNSIARQSWILDILALENYGIRR
jgi:hypothetical protein